MWKRGFFMLLALMLGIVVSAAHDEAVAKPEEYIVTGRVSARSKLPKAALSRYPDGYYTAEFTVDADSRVLRVPRSITIVLPGFKARRELPSAAFAVGDRLQVRMVVFEELSDEQQSVQIADTLRDFERPWYWCWDAVKLPETE